jgi:lysophospholipase L1-like esterase
MIGLLVIIGGGAVAVFGLLYWQAAKTTDQSGEYVALGSSFAAGIGLGQRAHDSPIQCFRTVGGYPTLVAKKTGLRLVDMSCSGSTTKHILSGGQLLLGPQLAAIGKATKLVTITSGGNDVGYIGDLMVASGNMGQLGAWWHGDIEPADARPYDAVTDNLIKIIHSVRQKAPSAKILIINYSAIIPPNGGCAALGISKQQADISRDLAQQLALATKRAVDESGAQLIDIAKASVGHDVCSKVPWVNGASVKTGTAFHPNSAGAAATADAIVNTYSAIAANGSAL